VASEKSHPIVIKKIRPEEMKQNVAFIFDRLEVADRAAIHEVVFIKPNIFSPDSADTGATTDLTLLGIVIDYFTALGKQVLVGEAGANQFATTTMFAELGIQEFCRAHAAEFLDLNRTPAKPIELVIKGKRRQFLAPEPLLAPNFLVDLPKFKTHLSTRVSWAIKNLYGLLPDKEKWRGHQLGIHETLLALSQRFPVDLVLTDAIVAMKGMGPTLGIPDRKNLLIGAHDQFVHDWGLLQLLKISHVPHIENCIDGRPLNIEYQFLGEDGEAVDREALRLDLHVPPLLFAHVFIRSNWLQFTLAPKVERFFDPKILMRAQGNAHFVRFMRNVQKSLGV